MAPRSQRRKGRRWVTVPEIGETDQYLFHLQQFSEMRSEEWQQRLFAAHAKGEKINGYSARDLIVYTNIMFVISIAREYTGVGMTFSDLVAEGCCGLLRALEDFDPRKGKLSAHAGYWIRQFIDRAVIDTAGPLPFRIPDSVERCRRMVFRAWKQFADTHDRDPEAYEVLAIIHTFGTKMAEQVTLARVEEGLVLLGMRSISLNAVRKVNGEIWTTWTDKFLRAERSEYADAILIAKQEIEMRKRFLRNIIAKLDHLQPRKKEIFLLRFGFSGSPPLKLEDVGLRYGVTRERVRQIEGQVLDLLACTRQDIEECLETIESLTEITGDPPVRGRPF